MHLAPAQVPRVGRAARAGKDVTRGRCLARRTQALRRGRARTEAKAIPAEEPWADLKGSPSEDFSKMANEEILLLLYGMDMDVDIQRALNLEVYDAAKQSRKAREEVDAAWEQIKLQKEKRAPGAGAPGVPEPAADTFDLSLRTMKLRSEMEKAVAAEDYQLAAEIRDQIRQLEISSLQQSLLASDRDIRLAEPKFRLGQRVWHATKGYRGVIAGWDLHCCETEEWARKAGVSDLDDGVAQLFYNVLVDLRDFGLTGMRDPQSSPVAYIPEELIASVPDEDEYGWKGAFGDDEFQHPYRYLLFIGKDNRGDLVPSKALRERFKVQRWDVHPPGAKDKDQGA
ncbi:unnamed protein product [Pedinophyceae sp. YPF-701]|nr:unnamed protein product [Pedinophyceae sp. YPF-701]